MPKVAELTGQKEAKTLSFIPCMIYIRKIKVQEEGKRKDVYYFDVGLYPKAHRYYVRPEYVRFALREGHVSQLNNLLFYGRSLPFASVYDKGSTKVVTLGNELIVPVVIRTQLVLKQQLETIRDILFDEVHYTATDRNNYYILLFKTTPQSVDLLGHTLTFTRQGVTVDEKKEGGG